MAKIRICPNSNPYFYGVSFPVTTISATGAMSYTATDNDFTIAVSATGGAVTVALPSASTCSGRLYTIKKVDSSTNAVTIAPATGTIDGATTKSLTSQYAVNIVQSDGTNWQIISSS